MKLLNCISSAFSDITYKKTYAFRMIVGIAFITAVIQQVRCSLVRLPKAS